MAYVAFSFFYPTGKAGQGLTLNALCTPDAPGTCLQMSQIPSIRFMHAHATLCIQGIDCVTRKEE